MCIFKLLNKYVKSKNKLKKYRHIYDSDANKKQPAPTFSDDVADPSKKVAVGYFITFAIGVVFLNGYEIKPFNYDIVCIALLFYYACYLGMQFNLLHKLIVAIMKKYIVYLYGKGAVTKEYFNSKCFDNPFQIFKYVDLHLKYNKFLKLHRRIEKKNISLLDSYVTKSKDTKDLATILIYTSEYKEVTSIFTNIKSKFETVPAVYKEYLVDVETLLENYDMYLKENNIIYFINMYLNIRELNTLYLLLSSLYSYNFEDFLSSQDKYKSLMQNLLGHFEEGSTQQYREIQKISEKIMVNIRS